MAAKQVIFAILNTNARAKRKQRTFRVNKLINLAKHVMRKIYRFGIESVNYLLDLLGDDLLRGTRKKLALSVRNSC